jgi:hypothetical protein
MSSVNAAFGFDQASIGLEPEKDRFIFELLPQTCFARVRSAEGLTSYFGFKALRDWQLLA